MAAQVSLASSAICSPDTSLHDIPLDTIELQNDETILTGLTPSSSPAGAAPRKDIDVDGGRIHFAGLRPLPALLREWTHGSASGEKDGDNNDDDNNRQKQSSSSPSRDRAQRTSSGTPIAVAVQNDRDQDNIDDLDGTIPPPPPSPRNHNTCNNSANPQASPLWSMLQSSVTAATTTATSGTAATSNAAAVLPAAALDSPPVKVRYVHAGKFFMLAVIGVAVSCIFLHILSK